MSHFRWVETTPGIFSLLLETGPTPVDEAVEELGHQPNGYFWEGLAERLVDTQAPELTDRFILDTEGDVFCAHGEDRDALASLEGVMNALIGDEERLRELVAGAKSDGFVFDD